MLQYEKYCQIFAIIYFDHVKEPQSKILEKLGKPLYETCNFYKC